MNKRMRLAALVALAALCAAPQASAASAATAAPVTISPLPGTPTALPRTQISFLGASASALSSISVVGSRSGRHGGRLRSYASETGASFIPSTPFTPGEHVTVHATWATSAHASRALSDEFTIATPREVTKSEFPTVAGTPADVQSFQSRPELHPPTVTVHQPAGAGVAPGDVLASPFLGPGQYGPMIFDNAGQLVWFKPLPGGEDAADLRTQVFRGKTDLTWWQGHTLQLGYGLGEDVIVDANYKTVAVVHAGNGLQADEHEFSLTPQGAAFVLAYSPVQTSLASAGGPANGIALDCVIQEIDVHTGLVMWEWHSLGHVDVSESYSPLPGDPANPYDYFHVNSVEQDSHGNLLVSARNTWTVYEIDAHTGAIVWRLGGKKSSFKLGEGVQFAYQHDATWAPNGDVSVFDDEGAPPVKPPSRGELIKLDTHAKTATLTEQLVRTIGPLTTTSQGDVQALPGGGSMVGWGGLPNFTEYDASGQIVYDAQLPAGENSYRVYREPWSAQPLEPPAIAARTSGGATAVYASWNGATTVDSWQLLTGTSTAHMSVVSTTPKSGFETTIPAPNPPASNCPAGVPCVAPVPSYVEVRALSASGKTLATSKAIQPAGG
jgi:Arylsulfotransferase (ASST)